MGVSMLSCSLNFHLYPKISPLQTLNLTKRDPVCLKMRHVQPIRADTGTAGGLNCRSEDLVERSSPSEVKKELEICFDLIHRLGRGILYLGSARIPPDHSHYLQAQELSREAATLLDCTTWSGAGPGLMDAVSKGALEAEKPVGGIKIEKEAGQWTASKFHPYLPPQNYHTCRFFSARKHGLVDAVVRNIVSDKTAVIALPGGIGTLDEMFEILTLLQLKRIGSVLPVPFIVMNYDSFYSKLFEFMDSCENLGTVSKGEVSALWKSSRKTRKSKWVFCSANFKKKSFLLFDISSLPPRLKDLIMESVESTFNGETRVNKPLKSSENSMGVLEVFVHQARDIHNICIYHKQDVYAKLCLTSDPNNSLSTKIINGGGRNPVFDDTLRFDVHNLDCSLKCEIFMMSRVKNYLEDQLLGFTLVPLSQVIVRNGKKLEKEFSLSSTDLFHSPAGFVELSLLYAGDSPEVMHIPAVPTEDETKLDAHIEFDESEFLDPKIVCENNQMVSNYFAAPCSDSDEFVSSDTVEGAADTVSSASVAVSSGSSGTQDDSKLSGEVNNNSKPTDIHDDSKHNSREANKPTEIIKTDGEPILTVNVEPEQKVVQQDIVDMYTKSLQQFTESLAKMKLPLDIDSPSPTQSENSSSSHSQQTPKSASSRVFYGSRAFF